MSLLSTLSAPWAITPEVLLTIQDVARIHARGDQVDIAAVEARLGRPMNSEPLAYAVRDGVAVLPIEGVIGKKMNMLTAISGGTSTQMIGRDLAMAVADPSVHSIILSIDSPGGTVDGTETLANQIRAAAQQKPVVALADGAMASAAYWLGSSATRVYAADGLTMVGSIGVVQKHMDVSAAEEKAGVKTTEITAGKFKRSASQYGPLTEAGREVIQQDVDYVYAKFIEAVATNRGVSEERVVQDMADGRTFRGQQAVAAGLIDGITSLDALIADLNTSRKTATRKPIPPKAGATAMQTVDQIRGDSPEAAQQLMTMGADAERARIQGIEAATFPGHEALIASMKFDGKTQPGDAALAVMSAEKKARGVNAQAMADDAPKPVVVAATPAVEAKVKTKTEIVAEAQVMASAERIPLEEALRKLGVR